MNYCSIMPQIDERATVKNVKALLENYNVFRNMAKRRAGQLKSTVITDMPTGNRYGNHVEDEYIENVSAQQVEAHCRHAIEAIENDELREILYFKYIRGYKHVAVMVELGIPERTYFKHLEKACVIFAEIYGIQELVVYQKRAVKGQ